ncbi:MAG: DUF2752 domain-containing protein [Lachnospiraceae bacterium]|nr:DUF2752 domain-containing protein [Lachnospiraceae bacterium]MDE7434998.1 DUF2752 domain-containing protein [Lachnospiraceae bacterium]
MYITGWCLAACLAFLLLIFYLTDFSFTNYMYACTLHTLTGLYCPGCGGTRAILFLLHGDLLRSFLYHPLVPYAAIVYGWFMISQTIQRLSRNRIRIGMHYRDIYLWIALILLTASFVIKNLLLIWHIDLLSY